MIYEHPCQYTLDGCKNIVERNFKTGNYTCIECKRKITRRRYLLHN